MSHEIHEHKPVFKPESGFSANFWWSCSAALFWKKPLRGFSFELFQALTQVFYSGLLIAQKPKILILSLFSREIQNNPEIRKRTIIIRYEDMSMHPWEKATEIYDFLGLEFDDETRAQFEEATGIHRKRKRRSEQEAKDPV